MNDYSNRKNQPFNRWIDKWSMQKKNSMNKTKNMKKKFQQKSKRPKRINFVIFKSHWSIALLLWDFFFFFCWIIKLHLYRSRASRFASIIVVVVVVDVSLFFLFLFSLYIWTIVIVHCNQKWLRMKEKKSNETMYLC